MICRELNKVHKANEKDINSEAVLTIILSHGPQASAVLQSGGSSKWKKMVTYNWIKYENEYCNEKTVPGEI